MEEVHDEIERRHNVDLGPRNVYGFAANFPTVGGGGKFMIAVEGKKGAFPVEILVHELYHATHELFRQMNVEQADEETAARMIQNLFRGFYYKLQKDKWL